MCSASSNLVKCSPMRRQASLVMHLFDRNDRSALSSETSTNSRVLFLAQKVVKNVFEHYPFFYSDSDLWESMDRLPFEF